MKEEPITRREQGNYVTECCVCRAEYLNGCGSTECCGSVQEITNQNPSDEELDRLEKIEIRRADEKRRRRMQ